MNKKRFRKQNDQVMEICIIATICKETGALSIYKQMIYHLIEDRNEEYRYFVFIDPVMPKTSIEGVRYIEYATNGLNRLKFDLYDFKRICQQRGIEPDVIFSLNNTGVRYPGVRLIIYYHQGLPLYNYHFSLTDKQDRGICLFTKLYPHYVKWSLKSHTSVVVQTEIVKRLFTKRYHFPNERVFVAFPDVEKINIESVNPFEYEPNTFNFIYPATSPTYKEHVTLARALQAMNDDNLRSCIRIHLTINENEREDLRNFIYMAGLQYNIVFHGPIPHEQLFSMYKSADGLLFPSVIETIGLPLLEAAAFGLPVLANDLEYVKDVLKGYNGLTTVPLRDYKVWGERIVRFCNDKPRYNSYNRTGGSDWPKIFRLIHGEEYIKDSMKN